MGWTRAGEFISLFLLFTPFLIGCSIYLRDDNVYEGPEDLMVRLNTNSTWVILTRARARVIITDEEDGE